MRLLHGSTRATRLAELFLFCCMGGWLVVVISFTLAGATPPRVLLAVLVLTMLAVLGCVIYLEHALPRPEDATAFPEEPGREPRGQ